MKRLLTPNQVLVGALAAAVLTAACEATSIPTSSTPVQTTSTSASTTTAAAVPVETTGTCATGDGINDACSCDADAQTYCAGFYSADWQTFAKANGYTTASWKYGLIDCLGKNPVVAACTASLARREVLNEQMMAACQSYCRGTTPQPGAEPCVDHLKSIYSSLSVMCRTALDAHEAAKSIE
jgi:hypothetical protein